MQLIPHVVHVRYMYIPDTVLFDVHPHGGTCSCHHTKETEALPAVMGTHHESVHV